MEQESVVYGCIKGVSSLSPAELFRQITINKRAILALPAVDEWPSISRDMFSVPRFHVDGNEGQTNIIHFGNSYRSIEYEWAQWIAKFENLLRSLYWQSAVVHLETELTGLHTFAWEAVGKYHTPGSNDFNIRCEWNHEVGLVTPA